MSFWGQQVNTAAKALFGTEYLRDYTHAAKTFRPNGYQNSPKFKFLFHVYFDINQSVYPTGLSTGANFGLLVKSAKLPSYQFDTHVLNQYNRKRIVQSKVKYNPIDITFHDDNGNLIRNLWYYYYQYYYNDSNKTSIDNAGASISNKSRSPSPSPVNSTKNGNFNTRNIYDASNTNDVDWGYIGESGSSPSNPASVATGSTKTPFFKSITIYGFNQHNYVAYTLINPIITAFDHDTYNYEESSGTMTNKMTLEYETVKYYDGAISGSNPGSKVLGFGSDQNYDTTLSPIAKPGSQNNILGQGGLVDAGFGVVNDLANGNILGAIKTAGTAYNTFKNTNILKAATNEVLAGAANAINPNNPNRNVNFQFPSFGSTPSGVGTAGANNGTKTAPPNVSK